jgi:putative Mg2+ transporter-C (MgtC) family protein
MFWWEILLRLVAAALFGAAIGWERETLDKPAGLRTHMMVGLGASCFTLVGISLFHELAEGGRQTGLDPIRVVEGVVTGIGFLGAGSIIKAGEHPHGLTTAAGVWAVGGAGAACGAGYFGIAAATTAAALIILAAGRLMAHR